MALEPEFVALMLDTVQFKVPGALSGYGKKAMGAAGPNVQCRVEFDHRNVQDEHGDTIHVEGDVYMAYDGSITTDHLIVVNGIDRKIVSIDFLTTETGPHHLEIAFTAVSAP